MPASRLASPQHRPTTSSPPLPRGTNRVTRLKGRPATDRYQITNLRHAGVPGALPTLATMTAKLSMQRVEVTFVGAPPAEQVRRASGVAEVEVDGPVLRCVVHGSFQPLLEALHGYEVVSLHSTPIHAKEDR